MTEASEALPIAIRVLGVDPGTRTLGYGVLDVAPRGKLDVVECGVVRLPPKPLEVRLEAIFHDLGEIIRRREPDVLAIEDVFGGKNFRSALKVGEARGVVVLAAQRSGLKICEYAPASVKRAATGNGAADKRQVQKAMVRLLALRSAPEPTDVTDALAVAFCHARKLFRSVPDGARTGDAASGSRPGSGARPRSAARTAPRPAAAAIPRETLRAILRGSRPRAFVGRRFRRSRRGDEGA